MVPCTPSVVGRPRLTPHWSGRPTARLFLSIGAGGGVGYHSPLAVRLETNRPKGERCMNQVASKARDHEWLGYYDRFPYFSAKAVRDGCHPKIMEHEAP